MVNQAIGLCFFCTKSREESRCWGLRFGEGVRVSRSGGASGCRLWLIADGEADCERLVLGGGAGLGLAMIFDYEELDYQSTALGDLMLRRRRLPQLGETDIFEVKLGEYFLMSSLYHEAEWQLSKLGLAAVEGPELDVVVGGLGLGYTAVSALEDERVASLVVVDYLKPVIEWHQKGLVPMGEKLQLDERCRLVHADFFALARDVKKSFDPLYPDNKHDAILLDIDHTPSNVLHRTNTRFYSEEGLREMATRLKPEGVFALWADGEPEESFRQHLLQVFPKAETHTVVFANPVTQGESRGAVYVARMA